ncbi:MAG TPA: hypothetical protein VGV60_15615 [Candidatus Polarisedimenticolia bacterium]|jgi:hypothetical protein|nr:hypothetical protein [Candidatus Polarisedimenticolia bacterium]
MTLLTAHRILIGSAVALFVYYGLRELAGWRAAGAGGGWIRGTVSLALAGGLGLYFLTLRQKRGRGDGPERGAATGTRGEGR